MDSTKPIVGGSHQLPAEQPTPVATEQRVFVVASVANLFAGLGETGRGAYELTVNTPETEGKPTEHLEMTAFAPDKPEVGMCIRAEPKTSPGGVTVWDVTKQWRPGDPEPADKPIRAGCDPFVCNQPRLN